VLEDGSVRACAGGIDDHAAENFQYRAHTRQIELSAEQDGEIAPNTPFVLEFEGNKGHDYGDGREIKTARLHKVDEPFDAEHPWSETLDVESDADGKLPVWILSSDVICQMRLVIKWENEDGELVEVGSVNCDFAAPQSLRRFEDKARYDDGDGGWLFYFPVLNAAGETESIENSFLAKPEDEMPAKVYMKFKRDETKADGYIDAEGRGNWQFVNSHSIEMRITGVSVGQSPDDPDGVTPSADENIIPATSDHVAFENGSDKVRVVTQNDGSKQSKMIAGKDIHSVNKIFVEGVDYSVWKQ